MTDALRTVGRYELLDVIGRGGAAIVYLAHQRDLERQVALKELAPVRAGDETFAARFIDESRLTSSLNHPNVVTLHEFFESDGIPYIAMEYLPRGSLRHYVGRLQTAQVAGVLEGVLAGLSHGERHGIAHRDLKPENLLVTEDGRVKISDFGVARAYHRAAPREAITMTGATIGTPAYMAPEQALGKELTPAADLYSLGVIAWEMLAGRPPFEESDTPMAILYRQVHEQLPPIAGADPRMAAWVDRLLAKTAADRFASADAAWDALEDVVLELLGPRWRREARLPERDGEGSARPLAPATFEGEEQPPGPRRKDVERAPTRRRWRWRAALVLVLAALAGGGVAVGFAGAGGNPAAHGDNRHLALILRTLDKARSHDLVQLRHASSAKAQGAAASAIAEAYETAAHEAGGLPGSRQLHQELSITAGAYQALASAARARNHGAYRRAASLIATDEARITTSASRL